MAAVVLPLPVRTNRSKAPVRQARTAATDRQYDE